MAELYGEGWQKFAECRNDDLDAMFVAGAAQNLAKETCYSCPVRLDCLADAMENREEFGVWGGMTERERRKLLREYPDLKWRELIIAGMAIKEARIG
jgi:WhiB family redox-sensing transcriptional regulator